MEARPLLSDDAGHQHHGSIQDADPAAARRAGHPPHSRVWDKDKGEWRVGAPSVWRNVVVFILGE